MFAILKSRTPQETLDCFEHPGKHRRALTGGWIADLAALGKCIWLCGSCVGKFNAPSVGYVIKMDLPTVFGRCDGCRDHGLNTMFVHHKHQDGWNGYV